jgi:cold shock CspA family protein
MWKDSAGYGFLQTDEKKDYFVHRFALRNVEFLTPGDVCEFDEISCERHGKLETRAINVWSMEHAT